MDKKIFNKIYAKFNKKDYFGLKGFIRQAQKEALQLQNKKIPLADIKSYLKKQKGQCYNMITNRLTEFKEGKLYAKRENFTWACIKEVF